MVLQPPSYQAVKVGQADAVVEDGTVRYAMCPYPNSSLVSVANNFCTGMAYRDEVPRKKTDLRETAVCFFSYRSCGVLKFLSYC